MYFILTVWANGIFVVNFLERRKDSSIFRGKTNVAYTMGTHRRHSRLKNKGGILEVMLLAMLISLIDTS